mmetsp:Transcript_10876/g.28755  ORF Transcript_10876/g.28755 Transcript_10876/m.28755 type:complete len:232 (+) Transcript_10876:32-727(+)
MGFWRSFMPRSASDSLPPHTQSLAKRMYLKGRNAHETESPAILHSSPYRRWAADLREKAPPAWTRVTCGARQGHLRKFTAFHRSSWHKMASGGAPPEAGQKVGTCDAAYNSSVFCSPPFILAAKMASLYPYLSSSLDSSVFNSDALFCVAMASSFCFSNRASSASFFAFFSAISFAIFKCSAEIVAASMSLISSKYFLSFLPQLSSEAGSQGFLEFLRMNLFKSFHSRPPS